MPTDFNRTAIITCSFTLAAILRGVNGKGGTLPWRELKDRHMRNNLRDLGDAALRTYRTIHRTAHSAEDGSEWHELFEESCAQRMDALQALSELLFSIPNEEGVEQFVEAMAEAAKARKEAKDVPPASGAPAEVVSTIDAFAERGIVIEILADGYKLKNVGLCYRAYVNYQHDSRWHEEDMGCFPTWLEAFEKAVDRAREL